jgi:hypothetical protein
LRCCVSMGKESCVAYQDQSRPCWEHADTLCKQLLGVDTCFSCEVWRRYKEL